jgi:predicted ester cyclase
MVSIHQQNKDTINKLRMALYDLKPEDLKEILEDIFLHDCKIHLSHPFENLDGPGELYEKAFKPLIKAVPDLERRDYIMIAGPAWEGNWVGCCGHYIGVFEHPWLDIPPTYHPVVMRFHEFYRLEEGRIIEMQAIWDIPQVMMQAKAWPMSPSLGVEWMTPAPATQNGLLNNPRNTEESDASQKLIRDMLEGLSKHAEGGPEAMDLSAFWHPKMTWYGPAGIGTNRRISGFRNWHQIPFLKAMPDRGGANDQCHYFFSEGSFVGVTGWPNMKMTLSGDGWMGIAPSGQEITMRSLDFWRCENGLIRENWVLVDLLNVYHQLHIDVFSRMREFTVERQLQKPRI